jgi:hypothetical protein
MPGLRITILVRKKKRKKAHDFEANGTDREETRNKKNKRCKEELRGFTAYQETQGAEC